MDKIVKSAKSIRGRIVPPGDKSILHRAVLISALAKGDTVITDGNFCTEVMTTLSCLRQLGVEIEQTDDGKLVVHGKGWEGFKKPDSPIDAGNSSVTARLLMGLAAALPFTIRLEGTPRLKAQPMLRVIEPLEKMGARIESDGYRLPIEITGGNLKSIRYIMPLSTSQVKAAVFTAALAADGVTELVERFPSRDHFERLMVLLGIRFVKEKYVPPQPQVEDELERRLKAKMKSPLDVQRGDLFKLRGGQLPRAGQTIEIPADISAAAIFVAAAVLLRHSEVVIEKVGLNPTRRGFLDILTKMRAPVKYEVAGIKSNEPYGNIVARFGPLKGRRIVGEMIPIIIDDLPIMAIIATQAQGTTVIRDAYDLRQKEVDRIKAIVTNLRKMGARIGELEDGMAIEGGTELEGAEITTYGDHRIAMAFAVAGLLAKGETLIKDAECVATSYPTFWEDLESLTER